MNISVVITRNYENEPCFQDTGKQTQSFDSAQDGSKPILRRFDRAHRRLGSALSTTLKTGSLTTGRSVHRTPIGGQVSNVALIKWVIMNEYS